MNKNYRSMTGLRIGLLMVPLFVLVTSIMAVLNPAGYVQADRPAVQTESRVRVSAGIAIVISGWMVMFVAGGMQAARHNERRMKNQSLDRLVWTGSGMTLMSAKDADAYEAAVAREAAIDRQIEERQMGQSMTTTDTETTMPDQNSNLAISNRRRAEELRKIEAAGGNAQIMALLKSHRLQKRGLK